jgi:hypothetical protein
MKYVAVAGLSGGQVKSGALERADNAGTPGWARPGRVASMPQDAILDDVDCPSSIWRISALRANGSGFMRYMPQGSICLQKIIDHAR